MINFDPFLPGLLTLSSSKVLIASRLFSDLPLPDSPLTFGDETRSIGGAKDTPEENALVLGRAPHMVVSIVGELEDVRGEECLFFGGIAMLCGIFEENGIRVAGNVFMGVHGDQNGGANGGIDVVSEKTLSEAGDYDVVRNVWKGGEGCEVGDILELLMIGGRLPVRGHPKDCRLLAGLQLSRWRSWSRNVGEAVTGKMTGA